MKLKSLQIDDLALIEGDVDTSQVLNQDFDSIFGHDRELVFAGARSNHYEESGDDYSVGDYRPEFLI